MSCHTRQSEFSGERRWTFPKMEHADLDRTWALESKDLGSILNSNTTLWLWPINSASLSFLAFMTGRITPSSNNSMENKMRCPCCLGWDGTVPLTQGALVRFSDILLYLHTQHALRAPVFGHPFCTNHCSSISVFSGTQSWCSPLDSTHHNCE